MKPAFFILTAFGVIVSFPANSDLAGLGSLDASNGFPTYYQDFGNPNLGLAIAPVALELCIPSPEELADKSCLLEPSNIPQATKPVTFPNNFPEETFYFHASAKPSLTGVADANSKADLRMALEATLTTGINGKIVRKVFSRLRYKFFPTVSGNYIIQTPYSIDGPTHYFASDNKPAKVTIDIGLDCATGDFSCALKGLTTPFLRASEVEGGAAAPFYQAHGHSYLAPPDTDVFVTGGPKGNKFKISVIPDGQTAPITIVNTNQFHLMGRVYKDSAALPAPVVPVPAPAPPTATPPETPPPSALPTVDKPTISISAGDSLASEISGDTGKFMINLDAPSAKAITIKFKLTGKAKNGKDYQKLTSRLLIPAGTVVSAIDVVPLNDTKHEGTEKVTLQLVKKKVKDYSILGRATASITIFDDD